MEQVESCHPYLWRHLRNLVYSKIANVQPIWCARLLLDSANNVTKKRPGTIHGNNKSWLVIISLFYSKLARLGLGQGASLEDEWCAYLDV